MPSGWPSAIAPPLGLTCSASSGRPRLRVTASAWAAKASLSSMTSKSPIFEVEPRHQLLRRGHRPDAHHARRHARGRHAEHAGARAQAVRLERLLGGEDQRGRAVVDARGVAGGHRAVLAEGRLQFVELLDAWSRAADARPARRSSRRPWRPWRARARSLRRSSRAAIARPARTWLRMAKKSWSSRVTWNVSATFSAVSGIDSTPYCASMIGLTKRQPMVVS